MREKTISRSVENDEVNPLRVEKESKLIVDFAVPCIISMLVTSLYNIVDQIFIGQGVGMLGNAATNIAFPLSIACTAISLLVRHPTSRCIWVQGRKRRPLSMPAPVYA